MRGMANVTWCFRLFKRMGAKYITMENVPKMLDLLPDRLHQQYHSDVIDMSEISSLHQSRQIANNAVSTDWQTFHGDSDSGYVHEIGYSNSCQHRESDAGDWGSSQPRSESEEAGLDIVLEIGFLVSYHVTVLIRNLHLERRFHRLANCHLDSATDVS